jgi:hypothetical protein
MQDVKAVGHRLEQHVEVLEVVLVGPYRYRVADLPGERVGGGLVRTEAEHDPRAVGGEPPHDRPADAPGSARHNRGLASKRRHGCDASATKSHERRP